MLCSEISPFKIIHPNVLLLLSVQWLVGQKLSRLSDSQFGGLTAVTGNCPHYSLQLSISGLICSNTVVQIILSFFNFFFLSRSLYKCNVLVVLLWTLEVLTVNLCSVGNQLFTPMFVSVITDKISPLTPCLPRKFLWVGCCSLVFTL